MKLLRMIRVTIGLALTGLAMGVLGTALAQDLPQYDTLYAVQWSPDGMRLLAGEYSGLVVVWDAVTGAELHRFEGHGANTFDGGRGRWSPDGATIVTYSADNSARLWDADSGALLHTLSGHSDEVVFAPFSPDGSRLVTISEDNQARVWDVASGAALLTYSGHDAALRDVEWSADGARIATGSEDGTAQIWDSTTGETLLTLADRVDNESNALIDQDPMVVGVAWSPDNSRIAVTGDDGAAIVFDAVTGERQVVLQVPPPQVLPMFADTVVDAYWSPDGTRILLHTFLQPPSIWDAADGALLYVLTGHEDLVTRTRWAADGSALMTTGVDGTIRLWDMATQEFVSIDSHESIWSAELSPDGALIATTSSAGTVRLWDAATVEEYQFIFPPPTGDALLDTPIAGMLASMEQDLIQLVDMMCQMDSLTATAEPGVNSVMMCDEEPSTWSYSGVSGEMLTLEVAAPEPVRTSILGADGSVIGETEENSLSVILPADGQYMIRIEKLSPPGEAIDERILMFDFTLSTPQRTR
ncbi:MAG: WD40 repeat domain-containing protein [Chloroflexi bacterium]|nr:WD40 repeat domain-containing protein [Chloroflexota bacterium]